MGILVEEGARPIRAEADGLSAGLVDVVRVEGPIARA